MEQDDLAAKNLQNLHHKALMATYDYQDRSSGPLGKTPLSLKNEATNLKSHLLTRGTPLNYAVGTHKTALHAASPDVAQEHLTYLLGKAHASAESKSYNYTHKAMINHALEHPGLTDDHIASSLLDSGTLNPAVRRAVTGHPRVKDSTYLNVINGLMRMGSQDIDPVT